MDSFIEINPSVMLGKPVITGTRITVELILERLAAGETMAALIESHPRLSQQAISAVLSYSAAVLRNDISYPLYAA